MTELNEVFRALSNEHRLQMLVWLKNPDAHFPIDRLQSDTQGFDGGVCVGLIAEKSGLAQSVVSNYLDILKRTGLIESQRLGKWTYYRYNAQAVIDFLDLLGQEI